MNEQSEFQVNPYTPPQLAATEGDTWLRSGSQSLRKVTFGISLVYYGIVLALLALIVVALAAVLSNLLRSPVVMAAGGIVAGAMLVVAAILNFVGPIVCLAVPAKTRCQGLITGSVALQLVNLAVGGIVLYAQSVEQIPAPRLIPIQLGSTAIGSIAFILFILFIKLSARYIGRQDVAKRASTVLNTWIVFMILLFVGTIILSLGLWGVGVWIVLLFALVIALVVLLMYIRLIDSMKEALETPKGEEA